jgi:phage-related holin
VRCSVSGHQTSDEHVGVEDNPHIAGDITFRNSVQRLVHRLSIAIIGIARQLPNFLVGSDSIFTRRLARCSEGGPGRKSTSTAIVTSALSANDKPPAEMAEGLLFGNHTKVVCLYFIHVLYRITIVEPATHRLRCSYVGINALVKGCVSFFLLFISHLIVRKDRLELSD